MRLFAFSKQKGLRSYCTQKRRRVMLVGCIFPEWRSSAAGVRTKSLVELFIETKRWDVFFSSPAKPTIFKDELDAMGVKTFVARANESYFNEIVSDVKPDLVIFDRFTVEEQFSWRVRESAPNAALVIDTQDLHSLRNEREKLAQQGLSISEIQNYIPGSDSIDTLREVAAIHRADHSLLVSPYEIKLLKSFGILENKLSLAPFYYNKVNKSTLVPYEHRKDFFVIGNFRHLPNRDQFQWLKNEIWPKIHEKLPDASLHIYGAYADRESMASSVKEQNFIVKGPIKDFWKPLSRSRVNLAPLRYGAGIKGKIADGWSVGTPTVTTTIGQEGMTLGDGAWGGLVGNTTSEIVQNAVELYSNERTWNEAHEAGVELVNELFNKEKNGELFINKMEEIVDNLPSIRRQNIMGEMFRWHSYRFQEYFSKFIELKNKIKSEVPKDQ